MSERTASQSEALQAALERLELAFLRANPGAAERFRPGLSADRIAELSERLAPYRLPDEMAQVYRWHDGFEERSGPGYLSLLEDAPFPSLEESVDARRWMMDFGVQDGQGLEYWPAAWFPAFGTSAHGYLITLEPWTSARAPVLWSYHSHSGDLSPTYDSVRHLIETTATLWEEGLLPWVIGEDPVVNQRRLRLVAEMNPTCFDGGSDWLHRGFRSSRFLDDSWLDEWRDAIGYVPVEGPLPQPVPIAELDVGSLSEPVPITGEQIGGAGGVDWSNSVLDDGTGRVVVHLSRVRTKGFDTMGLGDRLLFWVVDADPTRHEDASHTGGSLEWAVALDPRLVAEVVAVEVRPVYDEP